MFESRAFQALHVNVATNSAWAGRRGRRVVMETWRRSARTCFIRTLTWLATLTSCCRACSDWDVWEFWMFLCDWRHVRLSADTPERRKNGQANTQCDGICGSWWKKNLVQTKKKKNPGFCFFVFLFHFSLFCFFVNQSILPSFPVSTCAHKKIVFSL